MTETDRDDADIAILDFVAVMQAYGISAAEARKLASERTFVIDHASALLAPARA